MKKLSFIFTTLFFFVFSFVGGVNVSAAERWTLEKQDWWMGGEGTIYGNDDGCNSYTHAASEGSVALAHLPRGCGGEPPGSVLTDWKFVWSAPPAALTPGESVSIPVSASLTKSDQADRLAGGWTSVILQYPSPAQYASDKVETGGNRNKSDWPRSVSKTVQSKIPVGKSGEHLTIVVSASDGIQRTAYYYSYVWGGSETPPPAKPPTPAPAPAPPPEPIVVDVSDNDCYQEMGGGDSGTRFSNLTGEVEVFPDADPTAKKLAKLEMRLNICDHIKTGEDSRAIMSTSDLTTFVLKAESEVILVRPPEKDSKLRLVAGNIYVNAKKMLVDGSLNIDMTQAVAGIKGTQFIAETSADRSSIQVIEGAVEFTAKSEGKRVVVNAGEEVGATKDGLEEKTLIDPQALAQLSTLAETVDSEVAPAGEEINSAVATKPSKAFTSPWAVGAIIILVFAVAFFVIKKTAKRS